MLQTAVGPVDDSRLSVRETTQMIPAGILTTKSFFLDGVLVKQDQHIDVDPACMPPAGGIAEI